MKAVIYARFSSEKPNEASIDGQLRECMDYANKLTGGSKLRQASVLMFKR